MFRPQINRKQLFRVKESKTKPRKMSLDIKTIPVFVFPNSLKFYLGSKSSHKQLLTLYNPYDFPVRFKVLSTAPNKYAVIDPEGSIGPRTLVDIVVRHIMPTSGNCNITDKFRIFMEEHATKQLLGRRDIDAMLLHGDKDDASTDGEFHSVPFLDRSSTIEDQRLFIASRSLPETHSTNYVIAIIIGLVCVATLLLPTLQEVPQPSNIPAYLHVSVNFKLVLAYVLGLVSMVIFKA